MRYTEFYSIIIAERQKQQAGKGVSVRSRNNKRPVQKGTLLQGQKGRATGTCARRTDGFRGQSKMGRKIGYARVSTSDQKLEVQIDALEKAGCEAVFTDHGLSGARADRPALTEALASLKEGDELIVWSLDRLGRSLLHLILTLDDLGQRGVHFKSLSETIDTTTAVGRLLFHVIAALAEFHRRIIAENTREHMQAQIEQGRKFGRPRKITDEQVEYARQRLAAGSVTMTSLAHELAVHPDTLRRALRRL